MSGRACSRWPQGSVRLAGQYRVGYDEKAHAMTVAALQDIAASGGHAPGIKVVHLRGAPTRWRPCRCGGIPTVA